MKRIVIVVSGGLVQEVLSDTPDIKVNVLDMDREGEDRRDTADFLWSNRRFLRPVLDGSGDGQYLGQSGHRYSIRRAELPCEVI